ncbi:MAG: hypothetical protein DPW09_28020 [Anaerolineae bacterium]|nr:hypothetical protein [Anaerolineales bacterium]MCQ3977295.1 hypothetical protein [Anaerolineae bacterium]
MIENFKLWIKGHRPDATLLLILALTGLGVGLWASRILLDDAMITFRVAENLAYGRGFVYNLGERVQVTTTPLYTLILVPGVWLAGSAPRAALILNVVLAGVIPVLAYDLGQRLSGRITGLGGALLLILAPLLIIAFSMESYLYVAMILASLDAYAARRWRWAGVLVGLTAWVRGDAVLLGACLLSYDFLATRRLRWPLIIPAIAIPAGWYLFALLYYGSPFPATLQAKAAQGEFNWLGQRFADGFWAYWEEWLDVSYYPVFYLFPILMAAALIPILRQERPWLIMLARDGLYIIVFVALGVPTAEWYYAPLMPGAALLTARGVQAVAEGIGWAMRSGRREASDAKRAGRKIGWISATVATLLIALLLAVLYPVSAKIVASHPNWKARVYPSMGRWIGQNTSATATLATIDIGHLGYWSRRQIIDIVGLAQPDVAPHIAKGDFGYAIRHYQPDLLLIGYTWLPEIQASAWFQENYAPRHYFHFQAMDAPLVLFSRRVGVKVQPAASTAKIQPLVVDFNRQIELTGYQLNQPFQPGSEVQLTLFWQAKAPLAVDFTVFVQLVDPLSNTIIAQGDSKPQDGFYPTPYWQPGETIVDRHTFSLPRELPPGNYDLLLGFYEAENGQRLQILDEAGVFKSDHVRLSNIQVQAP